MSDTARPKSGGDQIAADEVNADFPIVLNGGETLSGATTPVPAYVHTDGELYACDANDQAKLEFAGFVIDDTTDGNPATLQKDGVVSGFTGLTIGSRYYVQDTVGTIGATPGTYEVLVGIAISATQILIQRGEFQFIGSDSVDTDGVTTTAVPANTKMILVKAYKAGSGDSSNGNGASGGTITLMKYGILTATQSMAYDGAVGGGPIKNLRQFRATWASATTMTAKTYTAATASETEDSGYTITAYFYR